MYVQGAQIGFGDQSSSLSEYPRLDKAMAFTNLETEQEFIRSL